MPTYFIISGNGKGSRATRYTKLVDKILTHQNIDLEIGRIVECRAILLSPYSQAICETDDASNVSAYRPVFVSLGPGLAPPIRLSPQAVEQRRRAGAPGWRGGA